MQIRQGIRAIHKKVFRIFFGYKPKPPTGGFELYGVYKRAEVKAKSTERSIIKSMKSGSTAGSKSR